MRLTAIYLKVLSYWNLNLLYQSFLFRLYFFLKYYHIGI
nr:MAG TPA: hypothetical protein [Caudoviricetes sp.]